MRRIKFTKHGMAEDPTGQIVAWKDGDRELLARVTGYYKRPLRDGQTMMLNTRYFCGDRGPDVMAANVQVLEDQ